MAYRAKRRSHTRHTKRRKGGRRMGAIGKRTEPISRLLGLVVGGVAPYLAGNIKISGKNIDSKYVNGGAVILGYLLPTILKQDFFKGVGDGMLAAGGVGLLNDFDVLSGIPVIAGWKDLPRVNGVPAEQSTADTGSDEMNRTGPSAASMYYSFYSQPRR